jgi:GT2 family glycosyltransferase
VSAYVPLAVVDVELEDGLEPLLRHVDADSDVYAVFWWKGTPLGARELTRAQLASRDSVADLVAEAITPAVGDRLFGPDVFAPHVPGDPPPSAPRAPDLDGLLAAARPLSALPPAHARGGAPAAADVSVVIATRSRPAELARALESLGRLRASPAEIIVVDNDPDDDTRAVVESSGIADYVAEPRSGLSAARNAGIRRARGSVIAFTDDDAAVHPAWLDRLCAGFGGPEVMAVTGLVLPASLESPVQVLFEKALGGLGRGYHDRSFDREFLERTKHYGTPVWNLGAGVNLAIRREALERVGLFDERLGAGASGCSEDSELLYRLLAEGGECRYRPDAVVRHHHRADSSAFKRQMHDYARGHVAALFVQFARYHHVGNLRRALIIVPRYFLRRLVGATDPSVGPPRETLAAEIRGYVHGLRSFSWAFREHKAQSILTSKNSSS